jgi:uncharacterized protein (TIGR03435 family)
MTTDDMALVRQYAAHQSESAFATLVSRHTNLVYSASLRLVRDPQLAEEVTQGTFIILAQKAASLGEKTILPSWLYRTAGFVSRSALKREYRRLQREQEAYMQSTLNEADPNAAWKQISPLLEEAMLRLGQADRDALVLRFFEGRSLHEVGAALGASEDAAKKRVNRAVEKLRGFFSKRGVVFSAAALTEAISANSVQAAPAVLAKSVAAVVLAKGAAAGSSTLTLAQSAWKLMAWAKAKTALVIGASLLVVAGTTVVTTALVKNAHPPSADVIYEKLWATTTNANPSLKNALSLLRKAPPVLIVRPTHYPTGGGGAWDIDGGKGVVTGASVPLLVEIAWHYKHRRMILPDPLPAGNYDLMATLPDGKNASALQAEITRQFGLVAHAETRETDVWVLTVKAAGQLRSHLSTQKNACMFSACLIDDQEKIVNYPMENAQLDDVAKCLGDVFGMPIVDHGGLTNRYDFNLQWATTFSAERIRQSLRGQLLQFGLELKPGHEPVEMLVVEKVK